MFLLFGLWLLGNCAKLPENEGKAKSYGVASSQDTKIYSSIKHHLTNHPKENGFYPLITGEEAFSARIAAVAEAERTLDLQYYIWHNDETGRSLLRQIILAADRGVRVRLLLDDLNEGQYDKGLLILDSHPLVEVRLTNPFAHRDLRFLDATRLYEVNRRMHNKVFLADNQIGIVGGRNIGDEYFDASEGMNFGDFDIWSIGPIVGELSHEFDTYWNSNIAYPITSLAKGEISSDDLEKLRNRAVIDQKKALKSTYAERLMDRGTIDRFLEKKFPLFWGQAQAVYDPPEKLDPKKKTKLLSYDLKKHLLETQKELILISPYFIPGKDGMKIFSDLKKKNVETWVLTNSLASNDVASVFAGYRKYRKDLVKDGINLYELLPKAETKDTEKKTFGSSGSSSGLHGKLLVFDQKKIFVGSMNLDPRSHSLNTEMGIIIHCPELGRYISHQFKKVVDDNAYRVSLKNDKVQWEVNVNGKKETFENEPETNRWERFKANVSTLVIPESLL